MNAQVNVFARATAVLTCALLLSLPLPAQACKPAGLEHFVRFEADSPSLGLPAARAVVSWFQYARDRLHAFQVDITVMTPAGNAQALQLNRQRAEHIRQLLAEMNREAASISTYFGEIKTIAVHRNPNEIGLYVQPGCLKTQSCCPQPIAPATLPAESPAEK